MRHFETVNTETEEGYNRFLYLHRLGWQVRKHNGAILEMYES